MPPRRSSRSTRASVEPISVEPLPAKRKRSVTADLDRDISEKENVGKPASRARRSSSTRASVEPATSTNGRVSTRSRGTLPEVPESGDEDSTDSPPPVKKARPSLEPEDLKDEDEEESDFQEPQPKSKGRKVAPTAKRGKPVANGRSAGRASRVSRSVTVDESAEGEDGSEDEVKSIRTNRRALNRSDEDDDMYDSDDDPKPVAKSRKPKSTAKTRTSRAAPKARVKPAVEDSDDSDNEEGPSVDSRNTKVKTEEGQEGDKDTAVPSNITADGVQDVEEDEKSLFDPPPMPAPLSLPQTMPEEPAGPKARLVIHKMALVNFKSYAGRQEIGPFHKSFSSIVGPNGSGKSNTIDALLFVFGYRATKMRQAKLSELIHNSAMYPDLQECSVEVHFREIIDEPGSEAYEVVPDSELVVTRQASKNNSSRYAINGRASNYTEVQALLKGRGIDLDHKRFLILQGEVESIAQMKAKAQNEHDEGLLEYLEDIIGTSKYKEPIDEAMVEMERLQEERAVKMNRLRIVEKEKKSLENQKKEAEDYLRLKNEHVRAQSRLWQWILWRCFVNEDDFKRKIARLKKELADETSRHQADIDHLDALRKHYEQRETTYAEVQTAAEAALKDLAAKEKEEVGLQERKKHATTKAKKLKKSHTDDTNAKAQAIRDIEDNSEKMEKEKAKVDAYEASLVAEEKILEGIRDSLKDKTQSFHDQIEVKQKELQPWTAKINAKQAEIDVATSERDALVRRAEALKAAKQEARENLENLQADQEVKLAEYAQLKESKTNLQRDLRTAEADLQNGQNSVQEWKAKASSTRQKVDEARASQADNRSQNRVLDSLTKLKTQGRLEGFHGRLGSLGTIPDKYDVAISTACPQLHHMVVDTVEQGQTCIGYLRSQNVGRASFMILQKISAVPGMQPITTPENVPRLFDLVKPKEPRFASVFYKALGNTLVAENMEQANRIAYGQRRWKVVTLTGQLIELSGTMSGGGGQPARGGMSSKLAAEAVRPEVLRGYEQDCEDAARHLDEANRMVRSAEAELERLRNHGPQMDVAFQKLTLDLQNGKGRIADAEKRLQDLKSQSKPDASDVSRISALEKEIAAATTGLEVLQDRAGKISDAIKDLEQRILDIGGARLLTQKSKVDGIKLHINLANDEITKAEVAKAKAEKDSAKLDASIDTNKLAMQELETELTNLNNQLGDLTNFVTELRGRVDEAQAAAENSREDLETLKAELDEKDQQIQQFRQREMEIKQELQDTQKEYESNDALISHWQQQHDKLQLEEIDDDDDDDDADDDAKGTTGEPQAMKEEPPAEGDTKSEPDEDDSTEKKPKNKPPANELHTYGVPELSKFSKRELVADAEYLDEKLKNAKPDLSVLKEYRKREEEFMNRAKDLENITNERDAQKQKYDGLRKQRLDEFMAGFNLISLKLKEMYQMITLGGNAELELVDSMDPFSEGIIFSVMPPKKSWKNISNLSGGEKTLSSLALVFALHVFKPTPLYFMDEIDAALDFRNVSIVANYIKDRTKNAQFIIISLRNDMFELSHRLIGIYKTANATRSISIDNHTLMALPSAISAQ